MKNLDNSTTVQPAWHAEKFENVFAAIKSNKEGLAHEDAAARLDTYGHNKRTPLKNEYWQELIIDFAERGQRVLALARKDAELGKNERHMADIHNDFSLLGLVGIIDPPREEAIKAIAYCREAGIRVKMITGDHAITAKAVGAQMGIGDGTAYVDGGVGKHG